LYIVATTRFSISEICSELNPEKKKKKRKRKEEEDYIIKKNIHDRI